MNKIIHGNCLEELKNLEENSIDSIVTDPPYELGFMGKSWDNTGIANNPLMWAECLRVLKPGGYLLSFGGTRTYHRMACAIEDAGFEVRDMIEWVYGSGFPKSLNIGKSIENKMLTGNASKNGFHKLDGERREGRIGMYDTVEEQGFRKVNPDQLGAFDLEPTTDEAKLWNGWGTALKPAHEPICMARKPLAEKTVAENVLKYGTGGINIDESRVETSKDDPNHREIANKSTLGTTFGSKEEIKSVSVGKSQLGELGRFPANLIHDNSEEVRECFPDAGKGNGKGAYNYAGREYDNKDTSMFNGDKPQAPSNFNDSGNASRFFKSIIYQAKASKSERNKGCEGLPLGEPPASARSKPAEGRENALGEPRANNHPTVKPIALMEYLIKMVTPKGGTVLDPFAGSGSTLVAAKQNGYQYIGIEITEEYIPIIEARLK